MSGHGHSEAGGSLGFVWWPCKHRVHVSTWRVCKSPRGGVASLSSPLSWGVKRLTCILGSESGVSGDSFPPQRHWASGKWGNFTLASWAPYWPDGHSLNNIGNAISHSTEGEVPGSIALVGRRLEASAGLCPARGLDFWWCCISLMGRCPQSWGSSYAHSAKANPLEEGESGL